MEHYKSKFIYLWDYSELTPYQKHIYSSAKLGNVHALKQLASFTNQDINFISILKEYISIVITCAPYVGTEPVNMISIVAGELSKTNSIPFIKLCKRKRINSIPYYHLTPQERKLLSSEEIYIEESFKDKNVLLLDDLICTGSIMDACVDKLERQHAKSITVYLIVNMMGRDQAREYELDRYCLNTDKIRFLSETLNDKEYRITTRMLSVLDELTESETDKLLCFLERSLIINILQHARLFFNNDQSFNSFQKKLLNC